VFLENLEIKNLLDSATYIDLVLIFKIFLSFFAVIIGRKLGKIAKQIDNISNSLAAIEMNMKKKKNK